MRFWDFLKLRNLLTIITLTYSIELFAIPRIYTPENTITALQALESNGLFELKADMLESKRIDKFLQRADVINNEKATFAGLMKACERAHGGVQKAFEIAFPDPKVRQKVLDKFYLRTYTRENIILLLQTMNKRGLIYELQRMVDAEPSSKLVRFLRDNDIINLKETNFRSMYDRIRKQFGSIENALREAFPNPKEYDRVYEKVFALKKFWTTERTIKTVVHLFHQRKENGERMLPQILSMFRDPHPEADREIFRLWKNVPGVEVSGFVSSLGGSIQKKNLTIKQILIDHNLNWREIYLVKLNKIEGRLALRALYRQKKGEIHYAEMQRDRAPGSYDAVQKRIGMRKSPIAIAARVREIHDNKYDAGLLDADLVRNASKLLETYNWTKADVDSFIGECIEKDGFFVLSEVKKDKRNVFSARLKSLGLPASVSTFMSIFYLYYTTQDEATEENLKSKRLSKENLRARAHKKSGFILERLLFKNGELPATSPAEQGLAMFRRKQASQSDASLFYETLAKQISRVRNSEKRQILEKIHDAIIFRPDGGRRPLTMELMHELVCDALGKIVPLEQVIDAVKDFDRRLQKLSVSVCRI